MAVGTNPDFPWLSFPTADPFPTSAVNGAALFMAYNLQVRDTNSHTYQTDPTTMYLLPLGDSHIDGRSYTMFKIWAVNTCDQIATIQPIENVVGDKSYPDLTIGASTSFTAAAISGTTPGVAAGNYPWNQFAVDYLGVSVSYATAPTLGALQVVILLYHGPT